LINLPSCNGTERMQLVGKELARTRSQSPVFLRQIRGVRRLNCRQRSSPLSMLFASAKIAPSVPRSIPSLRVIPRSGRENRTTNGREVSSLQREFGIEGFHRRLARASRRVSSRLVSRIRLHPCRMHSCAFNREFTHASYSPAYTSNQRYFIAAVVASLALGEDARQQP